MTDFIDYLYWLTELSIKIHALLKQHFSRYLSFGAHVSWQLFFGSPNLISLQGFNQFVQDYWKNHEKHSILITKMYTSKVPQNFLNFFYYKTSKAKIIAPAWLDSPRHLTLDPAGQVQAVSIISSDFLKVLNNIAFIFHWRFYFRVNIINSVVHSTIVLIWPSKNWNNFGFL